MKILYYLPNITQANGGIRQYANALLKILAKDKQNEYIILHNAKDPVLLSTINTYSNLKLIPNNIGLESLLEKIIWYSLRFINEILVKAKILKVVRVFSHEERICNKYKIKLVYCPYQHIPNTTRKTITTLHDVQELHFPEFFSPKERVERAVLHKNITEKSSLIIVSYEHVKQDLITYFRRTNDNVLVCLLDMQNLWFEKFSKDKIVSIEKFNLPQQFIFYPAATWAHKNHIELLKAIVHLKVSQGIELNVVLSGHKTNYYDKIEEFIKKNKIEKQVYHLGVVTEDILYALYINTRAVVIPTLYEAGSFPLMESIMIGVPVICSNTTSLPETIGEKSYVFDPRNFYDIASKIYSICFDDVYRKNNLKNNIEQAYRLKNTQAYEKLINAIHKIGQDLQ